MNHKSLSRILLVLVVMVVSFTATCFAQYQETVLYQFNYLTGDSPAGIVFDTNGNILGTAGTGGHSGTCLGCGTVFELSPNSSGGWTETTLHIFDGSDGNGPYFGLIPGTNGNFFGTTSYGAEACGCGTVFELSPTSSGSYTFQTIYRFSGGSDGGRPFGLTLDANGNIYGAATSGGLTGCCGTVFELSPPAVQGGSWIQTVLYSFTGGSDGSNPSGVAFDSVGNLFGFATVAGDKTSYYCGTLLIGCGTAFRLAPSVGGSWIFDVIFTFEQSTGAEPIGNPVFDAADNLYGQAAFGGKACSNNYTGCGTIFQLSPSSQGEWSFHLMHAFSGKYDGGEPVGQPILDAEGNFYETAFLGGSTACGRSYGCGTVFKISPIAGGGWQFIRLWAFPGEPNGGAIPIAGVSFDAAGNIYGSTAGGGHYQNKKQCGGGCGVIYELSPSANKIPH